MALHRQSNMEFPVARDPNVKWKTGILNETEEMKDADYPSIRLFHVEHQLAPEGEKEDCIGRWLVCTPEIPYSTVRCKAILHLLIYYVL